MALLTLAAPPRATPLAVIRLSVGTVVLLAEAPIRSRLPTIRLLTTALRLSLVVAFASLGLIAAQLRILPVVALLVAIVAVCLLGTLLPSVALLALVAVLLLARSRRVLLLLVVAVLAPTRLPLQHVTAVVAVVAMKLTAERLARLARRVHLAPVVLVAAAVEVGPSSVGILAALRAALPVIRLGSAPLVVRLTAVPTIVRRMFVPAVV